MDNNNIVRQVIDAVRQVQESSGRKPEGIGPNTRPFTDVAGFDSLNGVEATVILSAALGQELPDSVFAPNEGNRILSINEIAENALKHISVASPNR